jgi:protein TonB
MLRTLRTIIVAILAVIASFTLLVSIPLLNVWIKGEGLTRKYVKTEVALTKQLQPEQKPPEQRAKTQPRRSTSNQRTVKAGPRFAMDLGAVGGSTGGANISSELLRSPGGGADGALNGDVDEKPAMRGSPSFQAPQAIRESEIDANCRLSFCVDANGKVYDVRIVQESPAGMGLGEAGRQALIRAKFEPARKDGNPVPFCGLEQPFEVKFRD